MLPGEAGLQAGTSSIRWSIDPWHRQRLLPGGSGASFSWSAASLYSSRVAGSPSSTVVPHSTRIIKIQGFPVQNGEAVRQHNTKPGKETKIPNNYFLSKIIAMLKEFLSRQQGTTNLLLHD
jgi:hypothetical protein